MKKYIEVGFLFLTIMVLQLFSCIGTNYKKLSLEDPNALIAIEDSLLSVNKNNQSVNDAIVIANNNVAKNYLNSNELSLAVKHFKKSISVIPCLRDSSQCLIISGSNFFNSFKYIDALKRNIPLFQE